MIRLLAATLLMLAVCVDGPIGLLASAAERAHDPLARIEDSRIQGGLCVIVGDLDDALKLPTFNNPAFVVQVLARDATAQQIAAARGAIYRAGRAGRITIENWKDGPLPYADNLISLLIVTSEKTSQSQRATWMKSVRPDGELLVRSGDRWLRFIKPRPAEMDEWSQWRHGPDRNSVSKDRLVDVPKHVQWLFSSSVVLEAADMVTARGRVFIQDRDTLLARDAFNGLPLWQASLYPHKKLGLEKPPALIVARDELVFALMADGSFQGLDAATGQPKLAFTDAGLPNSVLLLEDDVLVLVGNDGLRVFSTKTSTAGAAGVAQATLLWKQQAEDPHTVTAGDGAVYYLEGNDKKGSGSGDVIARDVATGTLKWRRSYEWARRSDLASFGAGNIVFEIRRPVGWREAWADRAREKEEKFQLVVVNAKTGEEQQKLFGVASSARHGEFCTAFWHQGQLLTEARTSKGLGIARYNPLDFSKPVDVFQANFAGDRGWGHCYPPVLTERFYINGQLHFTDLTAKQQSSNVITRGACHVLRAGYVPANGLIYTFPKHCVCFPMLNGTSCLAPDQSPSSSADGTHIAAAEGHPLEQGPAFEKPMTRSSGASFEARLDDWPMFRHDEYRTGGTQAVAPVSLETKWSFDVTGSERGSKSSVVNEWADNPWTAGPLSAPVIAGGMVFVAQCDAQRLWAVDAATGRERWHVDFSGRLDGPPSIEQGLAIIGCRDGWVYALRASDGALVWRRRIAPSDRRISTYGQLESAWPCASSVLISRGLAYVSAGLHPNSDGGIRVACLRPQTGELVWISKFDDLGFDSAWPEPHDPRPKDRPGIVSDPWRTIRPQEYRHFDLPVRDGAAIAVSRCTFDAETGKVDLRKANGFYEVSSSGVKMPRTSWRYTDVQSRSPLAVSRGASVFSTSPRKSVLFRADFEKDGKFNTDWVNVPHEQFKAGVSHASSKIYESGFRWGIATAGESDSYPRAMLVAGDQLFYAHPSGEISIRDLKDGREILKKKLPKLAWDSLAAASGQIYATTADGQLLCLGTQAKAKK